MPAWLDRGDIFLNTSRIDNAPVSLIEAMACGLCVVTTDAGGIPDMVRHGEDALVAPVGDAGALASLVASVLEDRNWLRVYPRTGALPPRSMTGVTCCRSGKPSCARSSADA